MPCTRDRSLSSLWSLSSLLLPHNAPRNFSRPYSSLRALLVSCSRALAVAVFSSCNSVHSFRMCVAADLNFSLAILAFPSSNFRARTSSSSSGASKFSSSITFNLESQSMPRM
ncbi:hypothetical protein AAZX31_U031600 [Glycine max]